MRKHNPVFVQKAVKEYTPWVLLGQGLEFLLLLTGTLLFVTETYGLQGDPLILWGFSLAMTILLVGLHALWKWKLPLWLLLLGLMGAVVCLEMEPLAQGGQRVVITVVNCLAQGVGRSAPYAPFQTPDHGQTLFFLLVCFAIWAILLARVVLVGSSFWAALLLPLPLLLPALVAELDYPWFPLLLVAGGWGMGLFSSLARQGSWQAGARLGLAALPLTVLLVTVVCFWMPRESYVQPQWAQKAQQYVIRWGVDLYDRLRGVQELVQEGTVGDAPYVDLANAGPRTVTGKPVLQVDASAGGTLYLRGQAMSTYTGDAWLPLDEEAVQQLNQLMQETNGENRSLYYPAVLYPTQRDLSVTITNLQGADQLVYYPYQPLNIPYAQMTGDTGLLAQEDLERYTIRYRPIDTDLPVGIFTGQTVLEQDAYRRFVYAHYLQIPSELEEGLQTFLLQARQEADGGTISDLSGPGNGYDWVMERASEVAALLDQTTQYNLQTPVTPEGEDFVLYFLNTSHQGYCMHYASAATLLLRMQGIPARYVSGYAVPIPESLSTVVTDINVHAWVEIYLDGYGWFPIEVTPAGGTESSPGEESPEWIPQETPDTQPQEEGQTSQEESVTEEAEAGQGDSQRIGMGFLLGMLLLIAAAPLGIRVARRYQLQKMERLDNNHLVLRLYGELQRLQKWGGGVSEELKTLAQKARFSQHTLTKEERDRAWAILQNALEQTITQQNGWRRWLLKSILFPGKWLPCKSETEKKPPSHRTDPS